MTKIKLLFRTLLLIVSLILLILNPNLLIDIFNNKILFFKTFHILWIIIMLVMLKKLFPKFSSKIGPGKIFKKNYSENTIKISSKKEKLKKYTRKMNIGAVKSAVLWPILLLIIGILYYSNILKKISLFIIVIFFYFLDEFCISVWCPLRNRLIKNKCCNVCRIYSWGYIMVFSPLIFIPSFWTYSILLFSVIILIQWEYLHYKHPERFYELYNANLMCKNCKTKCRLYLKVKSS